MTTIEDFYSGESVLVTGVTGFLGKAILEKILRSCPSVKEVCVLLRAKRGVDPHKRLEKDVLLSPMLSRVRREMPDQLMKVRAIVGDIEKEGLGLSDSDLSYLINSISIVIHSAASVKFNESLTNALNINFKGTRRVLSLCQQAKNDIKALVYVSTAYANCHMSQVSESVVKTPCDIDTFDSMSSEVVGLVTPRVLQGRPNTYTYSKCAAENLLVDFHNEQKFPIIIVRPSIIGATWKEPEPGYVDCFTGATGLFAATGKGLVTHIQGNEEMVVDGIPLDVVANTVVAAAWYTTRVPVNQKSPEVVHCCSGSVNPLTHGDLHNYVRQGLEEYPFEGAIRSPRLHYVRNPLVCWILSTVFTLIPFLIIDTLALLTRKKPRLLKMFDRVSEVASSMVYFRTHQWKFQGKNLKLMESSMTPEDKETFYVNVENLNWRDYVMQYILGIKVYIFKEDVKRIPALRLRQNRLHMAEVTLKFFLLSSAALLVAVNFFSTQRFFGDIPADKYITYVSF